MPYCPPALPHPLPFVLPHPDLSDPHQSCNWLPHPLALSSPTQTCLTSTLTNRINFADMVYKISPPHVNSNLQKDSTQLKTLIKCSALALVLGVASFTITFSFPGRSSVVWRCPPFTHSTDSLHHLHTRNPHEGMDSSV